MMLYGFPGDGDKGSVPWRLDTVRVTWAPSPQLDTRFVVPGPRPLEHLAHKFPAHSNRLHLLRSTPWWSGIS